MLGRVSFKAGGRDIACAFTTSAMCAYEEKFDEPFFSLVDRFELDDPTKMRLSFLVDLFKISVKACNSELSDDEIADIADEVGPSQVITLVIEAFSAAFPEEDGKGKKPKPGQKPKALPKK